MLPFTAEVLFAVFDEYNRAIRPLQGLALLLTASVFAFSFRAQQNRTAIITGILSLGWAWTGVAWHLGYFSGINFAAPGYAALFVLQGVLLGWAGCIRRNVEIRFSNDFRSRAGLTIAGLSAVFIPVMDVVSGAGWTDARFALLAPGATTGLTVGVLALGSGRALRYLMLIPVLWLLASGARAWVLDIPQDYLLPVSAIVALLLILKSRAHQSA